MLSWRFSASLARGDPELAAGVAATLPLEAAAQTELVPAQNAASLLVQSAPKGL